MRNTNRRFSGCGRYGDHVSFSVEGKVYLWGGLTQDLLSGHLDELACHIEQFDPYLEIWSRLNTVGTPHPRLRCAACASHGEHVYMYGGQGTKFEGVLSCLNIGVKSKDTDLVTALPSRNCWGPNEKGVVWHGAFP